MVHPDLGILRLDRHYPPGEEEQSAKRKFLSYLKRVRGLRAEVKVSPIKRPTPFLTPFELPNDHPLLAAFSEAYKEALPGREVETVIVPTVSDASYLYNLARIPAVIFGPSGGNRHSPDEYVDLNSVVDMANVIAHLIVLLQRGEVPQG